MSEEPFMPRCLDVLVACLGCAAAQGADWPAWRGPTGQGLCAEADLPLTWSATKNVKGKVRLPNVGNSTPVIWVN